MTYYSRLSDIVSYRLEDLLAESQDRRGAIGRIVSEIRDGLAGAQRSVTGAQKSVDRLLVELSERQAQAESLNTEARQQLVAGNEADARQTLLRRRECLDLRRESNSSWSPPIPPMSTCRRFSRRSRRDWPRRCGCKRNCTAAGWCWWR